MGRVLTLPSAGGPPAQVGLWPSAVPWLRSCPLDSTQVGVQGAGSHEQAGEGAQTGRAGSPAAPSPVSVAASARLPNRFSPERLTFRPARRSGITLALAVFNAASASAALFRLASKKERGGRGGPRSKHKGGACYCRPRVTSAFAGVATIKRTELELGGGARWPEVNGLTITCGRRGRSGGMGLALLFLGKTRGSPSPAWRRSGSA